VSVNVERATRSALSVVGKAVEPDHLAQAVASSRDACRSGARGTGRSAGRRCTYRGYYRSYCRHCRGCCGCRTFRRRSCGQRRVGTLGGPADEIRMQVLQRIDIFTDTRLRDQLAAQLQPIVDRASAEMVSTINTHVGGLLRAYIAEAIEREIEKWREQAR
jgi:hypothetical protein